MNQSSHHQDTTSHGAAGPDGVTGTLLADLLASLAAIGRSMQEAFDPRRFLGEFAARIGRLKPTARLRWTGSGGGAR